MSDHGHYETERQAAHAARAVIPPEDGRSILTAAQNRRLIGLACEAAGIELGEFDRRILDWISGFEDSTVAVFARLIRRAAEPPEGTETEWALTYMYRPRLPGLPARRVVQPYPDEAMAREAVAAVRSEAPEDDPALMRREIGPWKEAPETTEGNDDAR
jgi:hypothetical protein